MTLDEQIADYERRLQVGLDKLLAMELTGRWNTKMWEHWSALNESYKKLCKARAVMG